MKSLPRYSEIPAELYTSENAFQAEKEYALQSTWLLTAITHEFEEDGTYHSRELMGVPIIIWRVGDEFKAYKNVCPHRHSKILASDSSGVAGQLRCPYHGWEFNGAGRVCKIPDAQCFKGLKKEGSHNLSEIKLEVLGCLIFVRFDSSSKQSLKEFMGDDYFTALGKLCTKAVQLLAARRSDLACNWKLIFENSIEDYHTPTVHPNSFGQEIVLADADLRYELNAIGNGCLMSGHNGGNGEGVNLDAPIVALSLFNGFHATLAKTPTTVVTFEQTLPTSAGTCERRLWVFCSKRATGARKDEIKHYSAQVQSEDEVLMPGMQIGKQFADTAQLLGQYEARVSYFHEYLASLHQL
ncbi:MAG: nitrite reductase/ring-hydroxylating ferredoxin subunit [Flavobacteriales bacterium]|jgi:nitrite reductase/ring-hydroxylating ferredoxin subunit